VQGKTAPQSLTLLSVLKAEGLSGIDGGGLHRVFPLEVAAVTL